MASPTYDVVIIGSGPGGYIAAARAGALGLKVAVVERDKLLGGTCLHRGCIPTKALLHAADLLTDIKDAARIGITAEGVKVDWDKVLGHKRQVVTSNAGGVAHLMKTRKVDVVAGFGRVDFSGGKKRVIVKSDDGKESVLETNNVVLATGSKPRELPFAKFDGERIINSDHILDIPKIPGSLAILGGGVIGIEFASLFARLGTKVTVLEMLPRIVAPADADASKLLADELSKQGCDIKVEVKVTSIERKGNEIYTSYQNKDGTTATLTSAWSRRAMRRAILGVPTIWLAMRRSVIPAAAMISASPSLAQVAPMAPAASSFLTISGVFWPLMWGRQLMPASRQVFAVRAMLASMMSRSTRRAGVSRSAMFMAARSLAGEGRSSFCEQKEAKKLYSLGWALVIGIRAGNESFLVLFFKKERACLLQQPPG